MKKWFPLATAFYLFCNLYGSDSSGSDFVWSAPTTLSDAGVSAQDPQIVIDANGNATVIWIENEVVVANFKPVGGNWSATPTTISGEGASLPTLALDGSGNATAVWIANGLVQTATLPLNGSWGSVTTLSDATAISTSLAVNTSGDAIVTWERNDVVETKTRSANVWSSLTTLSTPDCDTPKAALNDAGEGVIVWHRNSDSQQSVYVSTYTMGGAWEAGSAITPLSVNAGYPEVSIDASGNIMVAWFQYEMPINTYGFVQVFANQLLSGSGSWGFATAISQVGYHDPADLILRLKADAAGNVIGIWNTSLDGMTFNVQANINQVSVGWGTDATIAGQSYYAVAADLAVDSEGHALMACMYNDQFTTGSIQIFTDDTYIRSYESNSWSASQTVSTGSKNGYPRTAIAENTSQIYGAVAWLSSNGTNNQLQVALGTKVVLQPPSSLNLTEITYPFGVYSDHCNVLKWTPSPSPNVISYVIYRNGLYLTRVEDGSNQFIDHNTPTDQSFTYGVAALDMRQTQSKAITISSR